MLSFVISLITLILLIIEMQLLNQITLLLIMAFGSTKALDIVPHIYLTCGSGVVFGLSMFTGWASKELSKATSVRMSVCGAFLTIMDIVILPFILMALAITLSLAFKMLS